MNIEIFIIGILVMLFGYNYIITKWIKYQNKKMHQRRNQRNFKNRY